MANEEQENIHSQNLKAAQQSSSIQNKAKLAKEIADATKTPQGKAKLALSFGKKLSKHWMIMVVAVACDIFALVPLLNVIVNLGFGLILFLYFGPKKKAGEPSELMGIVFPIFIGSAFDIILGALPVCFGAALIRIMMSNDEE